MMEIDYKKVVFVLIERGFCTHDEVRKIVGELAVSDSLDEGRNSQFWEEAKRLCSVLNEKVIANGFKPFAVTKTSVGVMEKIMRLDKRSPKDIEVMIVWATQDDFWSGNIRSPEKLRRHFDLMTHQMSKRKPESKPYIKPVDTDWEDELARRRAEAVAKPTGINLRDAIRKGRQ
jgi:tRNA G10  N-methylase Trm11